MADSLIIFVKIQMILQLKDAVFRYGDTTIFNNVNVEVNEGEVIGLVGGNGQGKSTLLSVLVGEKQLFDGTLYKKSGLTMGYLRQNSDFVSQNTLYNEMMSVFSYQAELLAKLDRTAEEMAKVPVSSNEYKQLAEKFHRLTVEAEVKEAYSTEVKVKTVLNGMGMMQFADRIVSTLSGGEKTKGALCKLLLERPELIVLDEPTNHLDYKTLDWLENYLSDKKSTIIVVSHDRYFLDKLCTRIWHLQNKKITSFKGNYTTYKLLKAEQDKVQGREYEKQQKEIAKLQDYVARNKVRASTADMAKSREKMLERMVIVDAPDKELQPPRFRFNYTTEPSEFPLTLKNLTVAYGDRVLLKNGNLQLKRGSKTALLGLNGAGKSSMLKRIHKQDPYDMGSIIFGKNVRMGYYDQENANLDDDLRVMDQLWFDNMRLTQTEVRSLLALVNLGAEDAVKQVGNLSGGEKAKLGLCMLMAKDNNFLVLDEPTNHLDLPAREALETALKNYTGTLLFVSHDRYFVNALAEHVAEMDDGKIVLTDGNYDDFMNKKKGVLVAPVKTEQPPEEKTSNYRSAKQRAEETNRKNKIKQTEKRITEIETELALLCDEMALPEVAGNYKQLQEIADRQNQLNFELEEQMFLWEELSAELPN